MRSGHHVPRSGNHAPDVSRSNPAPCRCSGQRTCATVLVLLLARVAAAQPHRQVPQRQPARQVSRSRRPPTNADDVDHDQGETRRTDHGMSCRDVERADDDQAQRHHLQERHDERLSGPHVVTASRIVSRRVHRPHNVNDRCGVPVTVTPCQPAGSPSTSTGGDALFSRGAPVAGQPAHDTTRVVMTHRRGRRCHGRSCSRDPRIGIEVARQRPVLDFERRFLAAPLRA